RLPGVIFFCISDTLVPTTYLVDTTLSYASDYDQTALAGRLLITEHCVKMKTVKLSAIELHDMIRTLLNQKYWV
ncbi:hypothetical protein ACB287_25535, partial [Citrobacter freundii]